MTGDRASEGRMSLAVKGVLPLLLLAALLAVFAQVGPIGVFRAAFPPIEELTFERIAFPQAGLIRVYLVNGGPESVTISQVIVDDAYWEHTVTPDREVGRLDDVVVEIPYPWVDGDPVAVSIVSSTGVTFTEEVDVATQSPQINRSYVVTFALLGVYVGVIPVFLGLLWLPFLRGVSRRWVDFFLSFTVGLLLFLGVDALEGAFALTGQVASAFQGVGLIVLGAVGTPLVIHAMSQLGRQDSGLSPLRLSALIAIGIGLHNLGEGLAIGSSYAVGEVALKYCSRSAPVNPRMTVPVRMPTMAITTNSSSKEKPLQVREANVLIQSFTAFGAVGTQREQQKVAAIAFVHIGRTPGIGLEFLEIAVLIVVFRLGESGGFRDQRLEPLVR